MRLTLQRFDLKDHVGGVRAFHQAALASVRWFGRIWEAGTFASVRLRTREFGKDIDLAKWMFRNGRIRLLPTFKGSLRAGRIFSRVKKVEKEMGRQS